VLTPGARRRAGRFTWKIDTFSEISKRELRSNVFEVGSYKWCAACPPSWLPRNPTRCRLAHLGAAPR
jgi:hypothetical protein